MNVQGARDEVTGEIISPDQPLVFRAMKGGTLFSSISTLVRAATDKAVEQLSDEEISSLAARMPSARP